MTPNAFSALEGFESVEARRKRLGQYFSGQPVSRLLCALAASRSIKSVVDPMGGRADMLVAAKAFIPGIEQLDGIEIDPGAHDEALAVLRENASGANSTYLLGNAFDPQFVLALNPRGYDLVVTNPPYVRYQAQKDAAGKTARLPSALEVRNGLRDCLKQLKLLDDEDRAAFLALCEGYSGLADLAVPSWILCAALTRVGGTLAMVVPDAWLNRDYATVVQYLLLRWFEVEFIVEDAHASWFSDALVKTTLMVAKRVARRRSAGDWQDEHYLHLALPSQLKTQDSLVGNASLGNPAIADTRFAKLARQALKNPIVVLPDSVVAHRVRLADQAAAVLGAAKGESWLAAMKEAGSPIAAAAIPTLLRAVMHGAKPITNLSALGVKVGQGLRTGANDFFYADFVKRTPKTVLRLSKLFGNRMLEVPADAALPVVRRQADVDEEAACIDTSMLPGAVLALQNWALPEHSDSFLKIMPRKLASHMRLAAKTAVGEGAKSKLIPSLSAVVTNVRKANPKTGIHARYWYMLPGFAPRHRPDLFIGRVNTERPRVVLNPERKALIDANFSTLWVDGDAVTPHELLAYLSSTFAATVFEYSGSVMGGGALKLEATHLKEFPVPHFSASEKTALDNLGRQLCASTKKEQTATIRAIDRIVWTAIFGTKKSQEAARRVQAALIYRISARRKRK